MSNSLVFLKPEYNLPPFISPVKRNFWKNLPVTEMKLKDKVAIITGAAQGLGLEVALAYAQEGASIVLADIQVSEMEKVAQELHSLGSKALSIPTDVSSEKEVNILVNRTLQEFGRINILVNNAAIGFQGDSPARCSIKDLALKDWEAVLKVNLTGAFLCSRAVMVLMMKQRSGVIINISSSMGIKGQAGMGTYSVSKFGLEGLTQVLAAELAEFNIRVNILNPGGRVATRGRLRGAEKLPPDTLKPEVIRGTAVYLASDESANITGQRFNALEWNKEHGLGNLSKFLYV